MSLNVDLLEQSFDQVKPYGTDFAETFYSYLFTAHPEAKPLFAHTNMPEQRKKLLDSLVLVIENVRTPDALVSPLRGLGARHVKYGALPEHYPWVGEALLKTFEFYLGSNWTADVKQAWVGAYQTITQIMLEGADYSEDVLTIGQSQPQGSTLNVPSETEGLGTVLAVMGGFVIIGFLIILL